MALYRDVTQFVRTAVHHPAWNGGTSGWRLALQVLQKEIGSSPRRRRSTPWRSSPAARPSRPPDGGARARRSRASAPPTTSKLEHLLELVRFSTTSCSSSPSSEHHALSRRGARARAPRSRPSVAGCPTIEREAAIQRFRDRARILVSTDAGGEGRNLQFCRRVVNFDLPWNPMKIEQRIGRVHRLGQERDVFVHNYSARIRSRPTCSRSCNRVDLFALVVELDMVLGHYPEAPALEETIFKLWTASDDEKEVERGSGAWGRARDRPRALRARHGTSIDRSSRPCARRSGSARVPRRVTHGE